MGCVVVVRALRQTGQQARKRAAGNPTRALATDKLLAWKRGVEEGIRAKREVHVALRCPAGGERWFQ